VGESLEVGSWLENLGSSSFEVRAVISGATDRKARALARIHFVSVDAKSGRTVPAPTSLPSAAAVNPLTQLPVLTDYLTSVTGIPETWMPTAG
jgi:acyl-CoA thioesterase FadM